MKSKIMSTMFAKSSIPSLFLISIIILIASRGGICSPLVGEPINGPASQINQQTSLIGQQQTELAANSTSGPESDTSQANSNASQTNSNANTHQVDQPAPNAGQVAMAGPPLAVQPAKLPNINIYISKNEIRKLLGIDTRINYVTNGHINTYPFGFTIPLGYNQSDIIFTWQNLGPTNVNYSIVLTIGNTEAVGAPVINITRVGLIPRHEQVFKITLPCSGKRTDEVDVQVLITISGMVPVETYNNDMMISGDHQDGAISGSAQDQLNADMQLASMTMARQQLATAQQMQQQTGSDNVNSTDGMQSDEALAQPQMRLVSHTLTIKRKKICTMHPVPIQPKVFAPNQVATTPRGPQLVHTGDHPVTTTMSISTPAPAMPNSKWQDIPAPTPSKPSLAGWDKPTVVHEHQTRPNQQQPAQTSSEPNGAEPSHHPSLGPPLDSLDQLPPPATASGRPQAPLPPTRKPGLLGGASANANANDAGATFTYPNWPNRPMAAENPLATLIKQQQQQQQTSQLIPQVATAANGNSNNPLMLTLIVMSLVISVALVILLLLSSSSSSSLSSSSSSSTMSRKSHPLDKLNALTSCLLRRAPVCSRVQTSKRSTVGSQQLSPAEHKHGIIGALRVPTIIGHGATHHKPSASSLSGLSGISGHSTNNFPLGKQQQAAYYFGATQTSIANKMLMGPSGAAAANYATGYYTIGPNHANQNHYNNSNGNHLQHHYQHPPTADLLGTGYQCQPAAATQQQQHATPTIHHIATGNTNQTTRLIWSQGNGHSPDGFTAVDGGGGGHSGATYMRLSNAPRSDSGSVYQTIY